MNIDLCDQEELQAFADICATLKSINHGRSKRQRIVLRCHYTAKRKPKEIKMMLFDNRNRMGIASV